MDSHDLYGLPLDRFTPERNALAKQLRGEGRREEAARVAELRKPSVAAWAVNQLVRTQRRDVEELFAAGDALQRAQSELVAGRGQSGALREASERERTALDGLLGSARGLLNSEGRALTGTMLERVSETLHAAALDDDARAQVQDGRLHQELRHVGIGAGGLVAAPSRTAGAPKRESKRDATAERDRAERLKAAKRAEGEASRAVDRAARVLQDAEQRRDRAAQALELAKAKVREARERAEEAGREHRRARRELERL
jgi:hypothetical protein